MNKLQLTMCLGDYPYTRPLLDGTVQSDRLALEFYPHRGLPAAFREMVRGQSIDVGEMAIVTHVLAHRFGKPLTAMAIPLWCRPPHSNLVCSDQSSIAEPKDLKGTTIGVRSYAQTSGVWVRGVLADEYGIDHHSIVWRTFEDAHLKEYVDPPFSFRLDGGVAIRDALFAGECSAIMGERTVSPTGIKTVIADADATAKDWADRTGILPINHILSVRSALLSQHPWLAGELMDLFSRARVHAEISGGQCPPPYGLSRHSKSIERLLQYCFDQQIIESQYEVEEMFIAD